MVLYRQHGLVLVSWHQVRAESSPLPCTAVNPQTVKIEWVSASSHHVAGQAEHETGVRLALDAGIRYLRSRQLPSGDWKQEGITGMDDYDYFHAVVPF